MFFASDNCAGAHAAIMENLARHAAGFVPSYGASDLDKAVERRFCDIFEREVAVFFVGTGTAANALALASVNRPGGVTFCHREAHVMTDECGAPEWFTQGARLCGVDGSLGRMNPDELRRAIMRYPAALVHSGQPMAVSLSQLTEAGTCYSLAAIGEISQIAQGAGLPVHMDGARFANALVNLGCTPAEMTWKSGVDMLSFGGTKNGCFCAEAVIFFNPDTARGFPFLRKRAGQLFSKSRFIAAQFDAYLDGGLWLELARHANRMAQDLSTNIRASSTMRLAWEPEGNEVFAILKRTDAKRLRAAGAVFGEWTVPYGDTVEIADDEMLVRLVTSFATATEEIGQLAEQTNL